jgi:hypothetical protein
MQCNQIKSNTTKCAKEHQNIETITDRNQVKQELNLTTNAAQAPA